jgi:hypothetical protein
MMINVNASLTESAETGRLFPLSFASRRESRAIGEFTASFFGTQNAKFNAEIAEKLSPINLLSSGSQRHF